MSGPTFTLFGALFGFVLSRARVTDYDTMAGMFRLADFHVAGVIGSAIATAALGLWLMRRAYQRQPQEWVPGHIDNARHLTGAEIVDRAGEVPTDRPVAVVCSSGYRSSVAASVLAQRGHPRVFNVLGGMTAWMHAGFPVVKRK